MISPSVVGETSHDYEDNQQWQSNTRRCYNRHNGNRIWGDRNSYSEWNICSLDLSVIFLERQMMIQTDGLDIKMNRWPIQAPSKRANHQESFILRHTGEAFQDHLPLLKVSIHNCKKSQTSNSIKYKKCVKAVKLISLTYRWYAPSCSSRTLCSSVWSHSFGLMVFHPRWAQYVTARSFLFVFLEPWKEL